jgi:hypothetical protein
VMISKDNPINGMLYLERLNKLYMYFLLLPCQNLDV